MLELVASVVATLAALVVWGLWRRANARRHALDALHLEAYNDDRQKRNAIKRAHGLSGKQYRKLQNAMRRQARNG